MRVSADAAFPLTEQPDVCVSLEHKVKPAVADAK